MLFSRKHSIVVPFDCHNTESFDDFEHQVLFLKDHYKLVKLSEIVDRLKRGKGQGFASIVFENPRKGVLARAVPVLLSFQAPFTLFVDVDYMGLNRLPVDEELRVYQNYYPDKFSLEDLKNWIELARFDSKKIDLFLKECRNHFGPLPIEKLDSFLFFTTWGKLMELPPDLAEFGIKTFQKIEDGAEWNEKVQFFKDQLKKPPFLIRAPLQGFSESEKTVLEKTGIIASLGHELSEVTQDTDVFNLPVWRLS